MRENESEFQAAATEDTGARSWSANGSDAATSAIDGGEATDDSTASATDTDNTAFLADLAKAMQTTAGAEHVRVSEDTERRRGEHLDRVRAREAAEADQLRELAENDVRGIDAWANAEIERIQRERERRILSRRRDLESSVDDHRALVGREVEAVEAAIIGYRSQVDLFFSRLGAETDPVAIARHAGSRPVFPDLAAIGPDDAPAPGPAVVEAASSDVDQSSGDEPPAGSGEGSTPDASADSADDIPMVGVMDQGSTTEPEAPSETEAEPVAGAWVDTSPGSPDTDKPVEVEQEQGQPVETTGQANSVIPRSSAALLQAVPSLRPMTSWFRRDGDHSARSEE